MASNHFNINVGPSLNSGHVPQGWREKSSDGSTPVQGKAECSRCLVSYWVPSGAKPRCPLCDANVTIQDLRAALRKAIAERDAAHETASRATAHTDLVLAMRSTVDLMSAEDIGFIKGILYRYRESKSTINVKVTHSITGKVNGFLIAHRVDKRQDLESYACTSVGGVALAGYVEEAIKQVGQPGAMAILMKALAITLAQPEE
jgi:hypothetical protein